MIKNIVGFKGKVDAVHELAREETRRIVHEFHELNISVFYLGNKLV